MARILHKLEPPTALPISALFLWIQRVLQSLNMVRTTTRSQRQPSQSQLRQTRGGQSQRVRRGHAVEDEDGEEEHGQDEEDIDENAEGDNMDDGGDVQNVST